MNRILMCLLLLFVAACSSSGPKTITLNIYSEPEGASIIEDGKIIGQAPLSVAYSVTESDVETGYKKISPLTARWLSGATAEDTYPYILTDSSAYDLTLRRPADAPNLNMDLGLAEKLKTRREEAQLQKEIASAPARQKRAENLYKIGTEMMRTGRLPSTGPATKQSNQIRLKSFLKNSYTRGMNRFCVYDNGNVVNVGGGFCRPSI